MATLQSLLIRIGVDPDGVRTGVDKAAGFLTRNKGKIGAAAGALGAGAGALLTKGLVDSLEMQTVTSKLNAQLGLSEGMAAQVGRTAGRLYSSNFGDSMQQIGEAIRAVRTNIEEMHDAAGKDLEGVTAKVLTVAKAFDQELGGTTAAVGQMIRTGLAKNAEEALDILTRGFQVGNDKAGDLLDTVVEYSTQFRKVGVSGAQSMGLISQGLRAGARDADLVADAIKEFSIRAIDGSATTATSFKRLGLDAGKMAADIGAGGTRANQALDLTLDRLRAVHDPVKRAQIAVGLFGTQAEDLGAALFALDPSKATALLDGVVGAADRAGKALHDNAQSGIDSWTRRMEGLLMQAAQSPGALGQTSQAAIGISATVLPLGANLGGLALAMGGIAKLGGPMVGAFKAAGTAFMWLSRLLLTNPWVLLIVGVVVLAVLIVRNWDTIKRATKAAWDWVLSVTQAAWNGVWTAIKWVADMLLWLFLHFTVAGLIINYWDEIWRTTRTVWGWIVGAVQGAVRGTLTAVGWLAALPGRVAGWFGRMAQAAATQATALVTWMTGLPGRLLRALGNLGLLLVDAGKAILIGLWNGLVSMASWLTRSIMSLIKNIVPGPVLKVLGIASPSKLFAAIGVNVGAGLAAGMTSSTPQVTKSARLLAAATVRAAPRLIAPSARTSRDEPTSSDDRAGGARPAAPQRVLVELDVRGGDEELKRLLRKWVRIDGGGSVQAAFGGSGVR